MVTNDEIWNEDGTPRTEAVQAARERLREVLKNECDWNKQEVENFMSKSQTNEGND